MKQHKLRVTPDETGGCHHAPPSNSEVHVWREGDVVCFDDSFVHLAENAAEQDRVVLEVSVWHPDWEARDG